jgi:hypothetical protein
MSLFKKGRPEASVKAGPKLTKVYRGGYRVGSIQTDCCQPGLKHPDVDEWFDLVPVPITSSPVVSHQANVVRNSSGSPAVRTPKMIKTVFRDGVAEVPQKLATYLINEGLAWAKPQRPCNWSDPRFPGAEAEA